MATTRYFHRRDLERLKALHDLTRQVECSLDRKIAFRHPALMVSQGAALDNAAKLAEWLREMIWIAEEELVGRPLPMEMQA